MSKYFTNIVNKAKQQPPRYGRLAGTKNKTHSTIRWGLVEAYRQLGGVDGLVQWGRDNPDAFYPLLGKLIPAEMAEAGLGQDRRIQVVIVPASPTSVRAEEVNDLHQLGERSDEA